MKCVVSQAKKVFLILLMLRDQLALLVIFGAKRG
jgi:hypothetical protein